MLCYWRNKLLHLLQHNGMALIKNATDYCGNNIGCKARHKRNSATYDKCCHNVAHVLE